MNDHYISYAEEQLEHSENKAAAKKPPLGPKPYKIASTERINELLAAIGRYMNYEDLTRNDIEEVRKWMYELGEHVDLVDSMLIYEEC